MVVTISGRCGPPVWPVAQTSVSAISVAMVGAMAPLPGSNKAYLGIPVRDQHPNKPQESLIKGVLYKGQHRVQGTSHNGGPAKGNRFLVTADLIRKLEPKLHTCSLLA